MPKSVATTPHASVTRPRDRQSTAGGQTLQSRKRQLVRDEIVKSAANLFADRGVRGVSLEEVAKSLGYTKSSVYYYFDNKDELLWSVFNYISDHFINEAERIAQSTPDPVQRLRQLIAMHVRFLAEHKEWTMVFYRDASMLSEDRQRSVRTIIVRYDAVFREAIQDGAAEGAMRSLPPEITVNAILGACNWMVNWISTRHGEHIDEIIDTYNTLFLGGLVQTSQSTSDSSRSLRPPHSSAPDAGEDAADEFIKSSLE